MQLLQPAVLFGLLLVPAAVLLHVFRAPGRRHPVSYLGLWQNVLRRVRPEASERLKRFDWLLILEVLVIILLVVGLSRPVIWRERPRRHVGFIIDTSASMSTADADGRTRWQTGLAKMRLVLDRLSHDDLVSFYAGPSPQLSGLGLSPDEFRDRIGGVKPDDAATEPRKLVQNGLAALGDSPTAIYLLSDRPPAEVLHDFGPRLRTVVVGGPSRNVGIVALSGFPGNDGSQEIFVRVRNFSPAPAARQLVVRGASETPERIDVHLPPGGSVERVFEVPLSAVSPIVQVRLEGADDGFPADDEVAAVLRMLPVVAVGKDISPAYSRLFGGPVFESTVYFETDEMRPAETPAEALIIAAGVIPTAPGAVTVILDPPVGEVRGIRVGGEKSLDQPVSPTPVGGDPLMRSVDPTELRLERYRPLALPAAARSLLRVGGDVVAGSIQDADGKLIVLGFDAPRWQLQPSFVVFWANVIGEARRLGRTGGLIFHRPGDIVLLPVGKDGGTLHGPGGDHVISPRADGYASVQATRVGLCRWEAPLGRRAFAVNLLDETESDNRPHAAVEDVPELPIPASSGEAIPLGPWLCLVAGGLTVAWWHFRR